MSEFDPSQRCWIHERRRDMIFIWLPVWEADYRRTAKREANLGVVDWNGLSLDGWQPLVREAAGMSVKTRELYHSANGDRWCLAYDPGKRRVFVRHEPNLASGGNSSDIEIGTFLCRPGEGPEKLELLRLIATLVTEKAENFAH